MTDGEAPRSILATVEGLGKAAVAALGVIYALGLAVVSLHVAAYGASGLGFLHEQYVLAGMWALLPLAAVSFICIVIVGYALDEYGQAAPEQDATTRTPRERATARQRWLVIGKKGAEAAAAAFGWIVIAGFFLGFVTPQVSGAGIAELGIGRLLLIALKVAGFAATLAIFVGGGLGSIVGRETKNLLLGTVMLGTALVVLLGYLGFFTASVYPLIPATLGGGQPRRIQVMMKSGNPEASVAALLRGTPPPDVVSEHRLLFVTDRAYIVIDPGDARRAIEIPKDLVTAVRTIGR